MNEYLTCYNYKLLSERFNIDYIKNNFKAKIIYKEDVLKEYLIYFYKKLSEKMKNENINKDISKINYFEIKIDIYSPLFEVLSHTDIFGEIFSIPISINFIKKFELFDDYISAFDKLNQNNSNYSSIQSFFQKETDFEYISRFKINLNKIKRLTVNQDYNTLIKNYDIFFKKLFENIENNLLYLIIDILPFKKNRISVKSFTGINNLKSLEYLNLSNLNFTSPFLLQLKNLKEFILLKCYNIFIDQDIGMNIQNLYLNSIMINPKKPIKFPKLEVCRLENKKKKI